MDLSWSELLIVGIVALIIIGPKDLPGMFRELGRFTAKVRAMGREFSRTMEAAAKESGVKDVADDLRKVTSPKAMGLDAVKSAADRFEAWDPLKTTIRSPAGTAPLTPTATAAPAPTVGPNTGALYEKQAARKTVRDEAATKLKALDAGTEAAKPAKAPGRRRKKAEDKAQSDTK